MQDESRPLETYEEAVKYLLKLRRFGTKLGLQNISRLLDQLDYPQRNQRIIHVAGTNGKGSTCYILEQAFRTAGYKTGLFLSPHLHSFRERLQINRQIISRENTVTLVNQVRAVCQSLPQDNRPTFFEMLVAIALLYYQQEACDFTILETGMGGRLDATNIVDPFATVITNVGLDHQAWLGNTVEEIAREKAGIIKENCPIYTGATGKARKVIQEQADRLHAPLTVVDTQSHPALSADCHPSLQAPFQQQNLALALALLTDANTQLKLNKWEKLKQGALRTTCPGRVQLMRRAENPGIQYLLDVGHNGEAMKALLSALQSRFKAASISVIFGALEDKSWPEMLTSLNDITKSLAFVPVRSARALDPNKLLAWCQRHRPGSLAHAYPSLADALASLKTELVVITGSFYLVGEAMSALDPITYPDDERALNEYHPPSSPSPA